MSGNSYQFIDDKVIARLEYKKKRVDSTKDEIRISRFSKMLDSARLLEGNYMFKESTFVFDCKNSLPNNIKNIAVLTNHAALSASEMLVLYFKQSSKVTTFGEATGGAIDYLNNQSYYLPKSNYGLWVALLKMEINNENPSYDKTGIKPDVEISDNEPDWIDFIKKYYDKK